MTSMCNMEAIKPSTFFRSLSSKFEARLSPRQVAPCPPVHSPFDRWLTAELDVLRHQLDSGTWHSKALDVAVATQKMAANSITAAEACLRDAERKIVDDYIDDTVELLDACNGLRERLEAIREYTNSLAVALHCLEGDCEPSTAAKRRAMISLESCKAVEKRCAEVERCGSNLRKLGEKLTRSDTLGDTMAVEFHEALVASRAVALLVLGVLGIALSFKPMRGLPVVRACKRVHWSSSLNELCKVVKKDLDERRKGGIIGLHELSPTASAAGTLRDLISRQASRKELKVVADKLRRRCGELEGKVKLFGEKVGELYTELVSIRMALLGIGLNGKAFNL